MTTISHAEYERIMRQDFVSFIERSFYELNPQGSLLMGLYIELIAAKLEACRRGDIRRLLISLPPRSLKSHCASISLPAWLLGHNPSLEIVCVSYGQDLADKLARDTRTIMTSAWYQKLFPIRLSPSRHAVHDFMTTGKGTRMATSVGGVLTGRGGDFIIIDDPLKPDEALSETRRKNVNEWYDTSLPSRLNDKGNGCIIMIMQRLHQDDLAGHVLEKGGWEILSLPAIAEADEMHRIETLFGTRYFQRKAGEVLHPERDTLATLMNIRETVGEYTFQSQYQQDPTPVGGAMVKSAWLKYYTPDELPAKFDRILQSWDTASKSTELSDYSVCTTWGKKGKSFYLLNVFRRRLDYPDLKRAVKDQASLYKPTTILIEDRASGIQLIQELKREGFHGIKAYDPSDNDKTMRLHAQSATFENGQVFLPLAAHWLNEYVRELTCFPGSKYDDQVDSTTQALDSLKNTHQGFFNQDWDYDAMNRAMAQSNRYRIFR